MTRRLGDGRRTDDGRNNTLINLRVLFFFKKQILIRIIYIIRTKIIIYKVVEIRIIENSIINKNE
jgi:hypothetical protein